LSPIYKDKNTLYEEATAEEPYPGQIYMDAMHFGMGCSCLQITYETQNIDHARYLYDMLLPFTPIVSALSQCSPILKGKLSAHDFRWTVIEQAVDCRKPEEKDPSNLAYIHKSRYSYVSHYLSEHEFVLNSDNDTPF
jgi:glutamate--cysteine ligase catalytic subunit